MGPEEGKFVISRPVWQAVLDLVQQALLDLVQQALLDLKQYRGITIEKKKIMWGRMQLYLGLSVMLFFRYVDDLRYYLRPINKGWFWRHSRWEYDPNTIDDRDADSRTIQEIGKSLNDVWDSPRKPNLISLIHSYQLWTLQLMLKVMVGSGTNSSANLCQVIHY